MIFLSITCGIFNIGDLGTIGMVGKRLLKAVILTMLAVSALSCLVFVPFYPISSGGTASGLGGFESVYKMILDIIPSNVISPFLDGNAMQIIFLGACFGIALLVLGDSVSSLRTFCDQLNDVVLYLMRALIKLIPFLVFLSVFSVMASGALRQTSGIFKCVVLGIASYGVCVVVFLIFLCLRLHLKIGNTWEKLFPTFILSLTTASSVASFTTNLETCEKELGIPSKLANFSIPIGQVIFMPGAAIGNIVVALAMAEYYGLPITLSWLVSAGILSCLVAMASPPVPGGPLINFMIIFGQLGIPGEALAIAAALSSIFDFFQTATNVSCFQMLLTMVFSKLGMVDEDVLRGPANKAS